MIERGDEKDKIESRLKHDREAFKEENIPVVDYFIDSETQNVEQVADYIYEIYRSVMSKRLRYLQDVLGLM